MTICKYLNYLLVIGLFLPLKAIAAGCIKKNETVGLLELHQTNEDGQCIIIIRQNDPILITKNKGSLKSNSDLSKRRYTFTENGFLELYDPDKAQEFQFTKITSGLNYTIQKGEITIQLPSGQKMTFGESRGGEPGNIKSFQGFKSATENSSGLNLIPTNQDTLLASSPLHGGFPHEKKKSPFALMSSIGKTATFTSDQIFTSGTRTFPVFKKISVTEGRAISNSTAAITNSANDKVKVMSTDKTPLKQVAENTTKSVDISPPALGCNNLNTLLDGLNADYLKVQGELTVSKLAYFYLKDADQPTENLKLKITRLLTESSLKDKDIFLKNKVGINANLFRLKDRLLETQRKWSNSATIPFLLDETDFHYISLLDKIEKETADKKSIINLINMVDSSYRNSGNSTEEKFLALDKRFNFLNKRKDLILNEIKAVGARCTVEARSSCEECIPIDKVKNLNQLVEAAQKINSIKDFQWGSFWLHTGRKGK